AMDVIVTENWDSRAATQGDQPSAERRYVIEGTDDDAVAHAELLEHSPVDHYGLPRASTSTERIGELAWQGSVRYGKQEESETGDSSFQFDTGGGTQHITQSLQTMGVYGPPNQTPPRFNGAIGVTKDNVEGVDVIVPVYNF